MNVLISASLISKIFQLTYSNTI